MNKDQIDRAKLLDVTLRIGRSGLSESMIKEIQEQFKKRKWIKIKLLRSALGETDKKEFAKQVAEKTNSTLIHQVGFIIVLKK